MMVAIIGGVTAFVAATIATSQQDIKKVLAFSTVSQIGYMVLAVGTGAYIAAIFLMVATPSTRRCSSSGPARSSTALNDEQDMQEDGRPAAASCRWTYRRSLIGWLAIAGIPPFAGFWSKGDVLTNVYGKSKALWALGVLTAISPRTT